DEPPPSARAVRVLLRGPPLHGLGGRRPVLQLAGDARRHPQAPVHHGRHARADAPRPAGRDLDDPDGEAARRAQLAAAPPPRLRGRRRGDPALQLAPGRARALEGLTVLDLATFVAAPFCGTLLGEFGAEVIKVEQPGIGDDLRRLGRPAQPGLSYWWLAESRNKKSVTCNLRTAEG